MLSGPCALLTPLPEGALVYGLVLPAVPDSVFFPSQWPDLCFCTRPFSTHPLQPQISLSSVPYPPTWLPVQIIKVASSLLCSFSLLQVL